MSFSLLLEHIDRHITLTAPEQERLRTAAQVRKLKKKHYLLQEGEVSKGIAFVTEGILRSYALDKNGFEHVIQFAPPGWWIVDMYSFVKQEPARLFIDAIENSELLWLEKEEVNKLYADIPQLERFFRILSENSVITYQQRLIGNLSLPARERYEHFCRQYPSLMQCLPQKQIASYIGVTPEFLSKMLNAPSGR